MTDSSTDFVAVLERFDLTGHVESVARFGSGHINDTFLVRFVHPDRRRRYVLQRINTGVFDDPRAVMHNLDCVAAHIATRNVAGDDILDRQGEFVPLCTREGASFLQRDDDEAWRVIPFIYGAVSVDRVRSPEDARSAGAAFGRFQSLLAGLDTDSLAETIPGFHDTPARYRQFESAVRSDVAGRAAECRPEIEAARSFADDCGLLAEPLARGAIPVRIAHNDAKINNVLLDENTGRPACVVDLDTVMPGTVLYDFGDLVRTTTATADEDARDSAEVAVDLDLYAALVDGYLSRAGEFLTDAELQLLPESGKVITIETGLRFLTDFLHGDRYFRTARPAQNLQRCRVQFALAKSIDDNLDAMRDITLAARRGDHTARSRS